MNPVEQMDTNTIEQMVDRLGPVGVLQVLADVCGLKAQHIQDNWQDAALATDWQDVGRLVEKLAGKVRNARRDFDTAR